MRGRRQVATNLFGIAGYNRGRKPIAKVVLIMTRRLLPLLACFLVLSLLSGPVRAEGENSWDKQFQAQIAEWMKAIADRDPQFKPWQNARTEVQSLGANQHQWLVSIKKAGNQVGYLVVGETPESNTHPKFVLLEYGVGEYILFDEAFAPKQIAAEPVYDGFASHWLIAKNPSSQMINAKTGESYPTAFTANDPVMKSLAADELVHAGQRLTQTRLLQQSGMDPFDQIGWVHNLYANPNSNMTWKQLWQQQVNDRVTLTVPLHHSQVLAPFVVGSLHLWNDQNAYVGVWDEGLRFVPYTYANRVGQFHVNETSSPAE